MHPTCKVTSKSFNSILQRAFLSFDNEDFYIFSSNFIFIKTADVGAKDITKRVKITRPANLKEIINSLLIPHAYLINKRQTLLDITGRQFIVLSHADILSVCLTKKLS